MDPILVEMIVFAVLVFISGYITAAQISIASFGENKIEELKEKNDHLVVRLEYIQKNQESFYGSLQLILILLLIIESIIGFKIAHGFVLPIVYDSSIEIIQFNHFLVAFLISVIIVLTFYVVFGFLIPRAFGFKFADPLGRMSIKILLPVTKILSGPVKFYTGISNIFLIPLNEKTNFSQHRPSEDEILEMISEGVKSGSIDQKDQEIIENIFQFNDLRANEVMIPRTEMIAVDIEEELKSILEKIIKAGHSLIPVYKETHDNIIGVIHTKDLIKSVIEKQDIKLNNLIRPAYFIPETKLISNVLADMQQLGERIAIVTDEYGGTEGIITMEDILEEIIGEIKDRSGSEQGEFFKSPDGKYYVLGSMDIESFNNTFSINLPFSEEYNTVSGFVAFRTGRILDLGETFNYEDITFQLIKKIRQKMVQFKVHSEKNIFEEKILSR
ncbi:MAG TPA: hemolysin family protein, partial [Ignavibacteriaceae bacterium]